MAIARSNQVVGKVKGGVGDYTLIPQDGDSQIRHKSGFARNNSDAQVTQQGVMRDLSNLYKTLSMASIGQWNALGAQMMNKKATKSLTGRQAFMSVNRSLVGAGLNPVTVAPQKPSYPAALPIKMQMDAKLTGPGGHLFSLTVTTDSFYGDMTQVFATPFAPVQGSTSTVFKASTFKQIALLPSLNNGVNALQNAYIQAFGQPQASSTFALRFVGVSETGFKTGPRFAVALCLALSEDVAGDGDSENAPDANNTGGADGPSTPNSGGAREDGGLHVA